MREGFAMNRSTKTADSKGVFISNATPGGVASPRLTPSAA